MLDGNSFVGEDYHAEKRIFKENGITYQVCNCKTEKDIIDKAADADGIITVFNKITRNVLKNLPKCKVVLRCAIGYETIDIETATELGIAVCNIPDYCIDEVATHTMALMLSLVRKVHLYNQSSRRGEWNNGYGYPIHRLSSRTVGLVGFGKIAQRASEFLKSFGTDIVAYDPYGRDETFLKNGVRRVTLDELYQVSDIISLHVPLTKETKHLINKESISKMKDGVILVNTARGPVICLEDLLEAIKSNKVLAAGLDVVESEPVLDPSADLFKYENIIVNPHTAYNSIEAYEDLHEKVALSAVSVLNGVLPDNTLNKNRLGCLELSETSHFETQGDLLTLSFIA